MTAAEINEARRSLSAFRAELAAFNGWSGNAGQSGGRSFGKNFKSVATFALKEFSTGVLQSVGWRIVENWGKTGTNAGRNFGKRTKKAAADELKSLSSSMGGAGVNLSNFLKITGVAALAGLMVSELKSSFETAFEQERITISMNALSADGAGGGRIFEAIRAEALRTGIEISAQASTIQKMMAQGIGEGDALALNKSMLDIAGGTGLTTNEVELLGTALAQVKGKGVAAMEELRGQIAEKGVPIFEALRQRFGMDSVKEVFDAVAAGKVTADDVLNTFRDLEGPFARFLGASDRLGQTGGGLVSRLKQEALDLKRVFMEDVMPELKPTLEFAIGLIQRMKAGAKEFGAELANALGFIQAAMESLSLQEMLQLAGLALKKQIMEAVDLGTRGLAAMITVLGADDTFVKMMQRAALEFKSAMLLAISEILHSLEAALPQGSRIGLAAGAAGNQAMVRGYIAADDASRLTEGGAKSITEIIREIRAEFAKTPKGEGLSASDGNLMEWLESKIRVQRESNLAARENEQAIVAPGGTASGGGSKGPFDPTAMVAGGLANAISKITGGGDILLTKQLQTQEDTRVAAEATAKAAQATAAGVDKLVANTTPRRGGRESRARLTL